jgi:deoxyribose-phosphate aldolase
MLENASPLPKGWVRTYAEAREMISLGVKRIGTFAKALRTEQMQNQNIKIAV